MTEDWVKPFKEANKLYDTGKYFDAFRFANEAVEFLQRDYTLVLRRRMWSSRQVGYKDEFKRSEMYKIARNDAYEILEISRDVEIRNSAIKLLMLLPGEDIKDLCRIGIVELENAQFFSESTRKDLLAELKNSLGIEVQKIDPEEALNIFADAYKTVRSSTVIAGHLMQNAGTSLLKLKDKTEDVSLKKIYAGQAIQFLEIALEEYPADKIDHRKSTQNKIDKAKEEIENLKQ